MRRSNSPLGARVGTRQAGGVGGNLGIVLWTPAQLATNKFWIIGDDAGTVDGATVTSWIDASVENNDCTAIVAPTMDVATGLNGHRTVRFTASSVQAMSLPNFLTGFSAGAVVFVAKNVSDPKPSGGPGEVAGGPVHFGSDLSNPNVYPWKDDGNIYYGFGTNSRKSMGNPTPSLAAWHIGSFHSQDSLNRFYLNGVQFFTTSSNTVGWTTAPMIGKHPFGAGYAYDGWIAEMFFFSEFLSDANRQKAEGYLAYKYGLQSLLDSGHPYKTTPP